MDKFLKPASAALAAGLMAVALVSCGKKQAPVSNAADTAAQQFVDTTQADTAAVAPVEVEHGPTNDVERQMLKGSVRTVEIFYNNDSYDNEAYLLKFGPDGELTQIRSNGEGSTDTDFYKNGKVIASRLEEADGSVTNQHWIYSKAGSRHDEIYLDCDETGEETRYGDFYYDGRGRIVKEVLNMGNTTEVYTYKYDALGYKKDKRGNYINLIERPCTREGVDMGYTVTKTDSQGNWTKAVKGPDNIVRKIKYWE